MTMRTWIAVLAGTFLLTGTAFAAVPTFGGLDRDGNGYLDEAEITGAAPDILKQYDLNGDGSLDRSEFEAAGGSPARFDLLDADKNGRIDIDEFRAAAVERFKESDTNGDGRIDDREWTRLRKPGAAPGIVLFYF
ncbi:MAG: EF-hand domain-containing protein [Syntrophales bacterium]